MWISKKEIEVSSGFSFLPFFLFSNILAVIRSNKLPMAKHWTHNTHIHIQTKCKIVEMAYKCLEMNALCFFAYFSSLSFFHRFLFIFCILDILSILRHFSPNATKIKYFLFRCYCRIVFAFRTTRFCRLLSLHFLFVLFFFHFTTENCALNVCARVYLCERISYYYKDSVNWVAWKTVRCLYACIIYLLSSFYGSCV